MNIYKLLSAVLLTVGVAIVGPYLMASVGLMQPLKDKAWLILMVATTGLVVKTAVSDVAAGEFLWHKYGYDNCVIAFGAILSALALQLVTANDLFPGLDGVSGIKDLPRFSEYAEVNRALQLFVSLLLALILMMITALISGAIKRETAKGPAFLSLLNTVLGAFLLASYILVLVTKG